MSAPLPAAAPASHRADEQPVSRPVATLAELQARFQSHLLHPTAEFRARLRQGPRGRLDERLAVYADGYRTRLMDALAEELPALSGFMGEPLFRTACHRFVEANPSTHRNLRWYGAGLADWLAATEPWRELPLLAEIARFEWTLGLAFDAPDEPTLALADLAGLAPEAWATLRFALHPAVHLLDLHGNAPAMRMAADANEPLPAAAHSDQAVTWLVWREDQVSHFESVEASEAWALRAAGAGLSFPELCAGATHWHAPSEAPAVAAGWLRNWITRGLLQGGEGGTLRR